MLFIAILSLHYWDKLKSKGHGLPKLPLLNSSGRKEMPSARKNLDGNYYILYFTCVYDKIMLIPVAPSLNIFPCLCIASMSRPPATPLVLYNLFQITFPTWWDLFFSHHLFFKGSSIPISFSLKRLLNTFLCSGCLSLLVLPWPYAREQ